jgi:uncharacterized protein YndB with AHSA1/START domain
MTLVDRTARGQSDTIELELELAHPPRKVWRALTEPELLAEWLLPAVGFRPETGAAFVLRAPAFADWDGTVSCRILEIDEHRKLSYGWVVGDMEIDTVVTFTLTPAGEGTRLSVVQSGFKPSQRQAFGGARYGWNMMGGKLADLLERIA